jgi:hypothetical protein
MYHTWTDPTTGNDYIVKTGGPIPDFFDSTNEEKFAAYQAWLAEGNEAAKWE